MRAYLAGSLLALALFGVSPAEAASCVIITYYNNAAHDRVVGVWSSCPGQKGLKGRRTRFSERETEQIRRPLPPPGSLPCEFLQKGCGNLPRPR